VERLRVSAVMLLVIGLAGGSRDVPLIVAARMQEALANCQVTTLGWMSDPN